jgi:hypothetical protein
LHTVVLAALAIVTWALVLSDIYDRDYRSPASNQVAATMAPQPTPTPTEVLSRTQTLDLAVAFNKAKSAFVQEFANIQPPMHGWYQGQLDCKVYITSTPPNDSFRRQVEDVATKMGCEPQPHPVLDRSNADATPIPTPLPRPFIVIRAIAQPTGMPPTRNGPGPYPLDPETTRWNREIAAVNAAAILLKSFRDDLGLDSRSSTKLNPGEDPTEIYVDLGPFSPWNKAKSDAN